MLTMQSLIANANQILVEKEMQNLYFIKDVALYKLPIMEHQVTVHFEAREKYNIFENQLLQFIAVSEEEMISNEELEALIGLTSGELLEWLHMLEKDGAISTEGQSIKLTEKGAVSVLDGFSPVRSLQKQFTFYYEPVTSFFVENINIYTDTSEQLHPIVSAERYDKQLCPLVSEDQIIMLYKKMTNNSLLDAKKDFKLQQLVHHVYERNNSVTIQGLELFNKEGNDFVQAIWNSENKQLIRLA